MAEQVATSPAPANEPAAPHRDFRREVTDQIIEMLDKGSAPWQKPWEPGALRLPFNPVSDRSYRGGNALHLMAVAARKGYEDPRWVTYKQAQENGWQVRKGEKGAQIEFWQLGGRESGSAPPPNVGKPETESEALPGGRTNGRPIHRVYTVFNAHQIEGISAYPPKLAQEWEVTEAGERILRNSGAKITHDQNDRAFYSRVNDSIHLPRKEAFKSPADYYGTALHELLHWTGHPKRLNRQTLNESYVFGDLNYAKEELRAELASVFVAAERGIPYNPEQHAAYLGSWIKALRDDKNEIFRAATDAQKAADFVLNLEREQPVERTSAPQIRRETSEHVADYERGSGTVDITEKETATEHREPAAASGRPGDPDQDEIAKTDAEKILDGEVDGRRQPSELEYEKSLADAEAAAKRVLGDKTRLYQADTDSGKYRGEIIVTTDHHVVQQIGPRSAAIHAKGLLPDSTAPGQSVTITYSNTLARLKPYQARERANALSR